MARAPIPPPKHTVSCLCGQEVRVDPLATERRVTCPACNAPLDFVVSMDQKLRTPRVSIVIPLGLMRTEGESLGAAKKGDPPSAPRPAPPPAAEPTDAAEFEPLPEAPPAPPPPPSRTVRRSAGKTVRGVIATCGCGGTFPVDEEELTSIQSCPKCKVAYHVVVKRDENKVKSAILVPVKVVGKNAGQLKTLIAPKPIPGQTRVKGRTQKIPVAPPKEKDNAGETRARKGRPLVTRAAAPSTPPPDVPPGAQAVACVCGEYLIVRRKDVDKGMTCEACGRKVEFETARDPQSLAPIIRVRR